MQVSQRAVVRGIRSRCNRDRTRDPDSQVIDTYTRGCLASEVDTSFASRRVTPGLEQITVGVSCRRAAGKTHAEWAGDGEGRLRRRGMVERYWAGSQALR